MPHSGVKGCGTLLTGQPGNWQLSAGVSQLHSGGREIAFNSAPAGMGSPGGQTRAVSTQHAEIKTLLGGFLPTWQTGVFRRSRAGTVREGEAEEPVGVRPEGPLPAPVRWGWRVFSVLTPLLPFLNSPGPWGSCCLPVLTTNSLAALAISFSRP